jgi:predicted NBD/HSP70 family sugar kinase
MEHRMASTLNQPEMSRLNRAAALRCIASGRGISRLALSERLNLARSAITKIANELVQTGMVREEFLPGGKRDQPRSRLLLNGDWGHVLTINLSNNLAVGVVDLAGNLVHYSRLAGDDTTPGHYRDRFESLLTSAVAGLCDEWASRNLVGVGVVSLGHVDDRGIIREHSELPHLETDIRAVLRDVTQLPVAVDHETRLLLQSCMRTRQGELWRSVVGLNPRAMGTTGGHALMVDGRVFRGRNGMAGLRGDRLPVPYGGGQGLAMLQQVRQWGGMEQYFARFQANDPIARAIYDKTVANWAVHLAYALNIYNPDAILAFGSYVSLGERFLADVRQAAGPFVDPLCLDGVEMHWGASNDDRSRLAAAAGPVLDRLFAYGAVDDLAFEPSDLEPIC